MNIDEVKKGMYSLIDIKTTTLNIGYTPLLRLNIPKKFLGHENMEIYLKWEGNNPTGTHKDRAAYLHVSNAYNKGYKAITTATCGNYGVAIAFFSMNFNIKSIIFIPRSYNTPKIHVMKLYNAEIMFTDGTYEDAVEKSIEYASAENVYDANPGSVNDDININAYKTIAYEIVKKLGEVPSIVSIPVGNGTTLAGIYAGFRELYNKDYISRVPLLIGGTTKHGNQIFLSWLKHSHSPVYMDRRDILETEINEPLVSYISMNAEEALKALYDTGGYMYAFNDHEFLHMHNILKDAEGLVALPASTASLLALLTYSKSFNAEGVGVSIITGGDRVG